MQSPCGGSLSAFAQLAARLAALYIICRQDRLRIAHDSLYARVWAEPEAGLFAQKARKNIGTKKEHGKHNPTNLGQIEVNQVIPVCHEHRRTRRRN